jgi:hypothetical protein
MNRDLKQFIDIIGKNKQQTCKHVQWGLGLTVRCMIEYPDVQELWSESITERSQSDPHVDKYIAPSLLQ